MLYQVLSKGESLALYITYYAVAARKRCDAAILPNTSNDSFGRVVTQSSVSQGLERPGSKESHADGFERALTFYCGIH